MSVEVVSYSAVVMLFSLMALRCFRSGSVSDNVLGASQCGSMLMLLSPYRTFTLLLLLMTAIAYFVSQILTGARPVSRLLPLAGAVAAVLCLSQ